MRIPYLSYWFSLYSSRANATPPLRTIVKYENTFASDISQQQKATHKKQKKPHRIRQGFGNQTEL